MVKSCPEGSEDRALLWIIESQSGLDWKGLWSLPSSVPLSQVVQSPTHPLDISYYFPTAKDSGPGKLSPAHPLSQLAGAMCADFSICRERSWQPNLQTLRAAVLQH